MIDMIIVGAGASGMVAAIMAARRGASVLMLEHMEVAGKKILATGNGKCNYTNRMQDISCYRGEDPAFIQQVLEQFDLEKTLDFFKELGIYPKEKNGYFYPNSQQASSVREALLMELKDLGVEIITNCGIQKITKQKDHFCFQTKCGNYESRCCVLACGGKAAKKTGSDGSGFVYARQLGHEPSTLFPALVQLEAKEPYFKEIAGIRTDASVSLWQDGNCIASDRGEVQLTDYGISGIPVFQVSRFAAQALVQGEVLAKLDLMEALTKEELEQELKMRFHRESQRTAEKCLIGLLPQKLIHVLLDMCKIRCETPADRVADKKCVKLAACIKEFPATITKTRSFDQAQTCAGGIRTANLHRDLESQICPGLFFAGEMIDVDGKCGGYNLQWAWSSGAVAGQAAAIRSKEGSFS